jgi:hypothetical protein
MGRVKEFAFWLAEQVYVKKLSNAEIVKQFSLTWDCPQQSPKSTWLEEQIQIVRSNPEIYNW